MTPLATAHTIRPPMDRPARIADSFSRAAEHYDSAAEVQRMAADRVVDVALRHLAGVPQPRILEVGCGTGYVSQRLLQAIPGGTFLVTDLAQGMVDEAQRRLGGDPRTTFSLLNGEHPDAPQAGTFDLIVSSLAVQWFAGLGQGLRGLAGLLAPGGRLVVSTLGQGALQQWRDAHRVHNLPCSTPEYPSPEWFRTVWPPHGHGSLEADLVRDVCYADGRAFVETLQVLGAATPMIGEVRLGPGQLRRVFRELGTACSVTWRVLVFEFHDGRSAES
ncbi:MAG: methyltransferase [Myxococcota bacterium]